MAYTGPVSADPVFGLANDRTASGDGRPAFPLTQIPAITIASVASTPEDSGQSGAEGSSSWSGTVAGQPSTIWSPSTTTGTGDRPVMAGPAPPSHR